jgi:hypothetical protein
VEVVEVVFQPLDVRCPEDVHMYDTVCLNTDKTCALKIKMKRISELAYIVHPAWCVFVIQYTYIMINNNDNAWRRIKKNDVVIRTYVQ